MAELQAILRWHLNGETEFSWKEKNGNKFRLNFLSIIDILIIAKKSGIITTEQMKAFSKGYAEIVKLFKAAGSKE
jgi:hypothetical protein